MFGKRAGSILPRDECLVFIEECQAFPAPLCCCSTVSADGGEGCRGQINGVIWLRCSLALGLSGQSCSGKTVRVHKPLLFRAR